MKATISTLIEAVVLFMALQAQRVWAAETQGEPAVSSGTTWKVSAFYGDRDPLSTTPTGESIAIGPGSGSGSDILVPAGKWIVEATSGSNSDTAVLTVVSTEKILAGGEEGPVMVLEGDAVQLDAIPYPSGETYPQGCPVWSVNQKPAGSSIPKPTDGNKTVSVTPDKLGKYKILADYASIDLYSYRFEFERIPGGHGAGGGSIEGTSATNGYQDRLLGIYGEITSDDHNPKTGTSTLNEFGMKAEGVEYATDEGVGSVLNPSGERLLEVYLNVGDANLTLDIESNTTLAQGTITQHNPAVTHGGGVNVQLDGQETTYDYYILDGKFTENALDNPQLTLEDENYTGKSKIGLIRADVNFQSKIDVTATTKVKVEYTATLKE